MIKITAPLPLLSWTSKQIGTWLIPLGALIAGSLSAAAQAPSYSLVFEGGTATHEGNGIAVDGSGNIYVTGQYQGDATIAGITMPGAGLQDYFLASFDASGNARWAVGAGTTDSDYGTSVSVAPNGDLVVSASLFTPVDLHGTNLVGEGGRDAILARYSSSGALLWVRVIGGSGRDEADETAIDEDGNIILAGRINDVVTIGSDTIGTEGRQRQFLAKFDPDGNRIWAKTVTTETVAAGTGIAIDGDNNILFTGQERTGGENFVRVAKYDTNGQEIWTSDHGANSSSLGTGIRADSAGNVYVCGTFASTSITFGGVTLENPNFALRGFVTKYDANGNVLWASRVGGRAYRLDVRPDGTVYTCGFFLGASGDFGSISIASEGGNDGFITRHDPSGQLAWVKHAGSGSREILRSITLDGSGRVYVTGEGAPEAFGLPQFSFSGAVVVARLDTSDVVLGPSISFGRLGDSLRISWPASESGFRVEATANLNEPFGEPPATLTAVPDEINAYTIPLSADPLFLRLVKP